ncbi:MAG: VWA domain-containing protein [Phycisphaeraceae bacterium]|nr:VWA domain-containing protein [Phycisphaeraceae bacterium]MCW5754165.1 VWA domain-containing protein [Phycisphaeraceae bacterium]
MNALLNWLFGVDRLPFGDEGVVFAFQRPLPAWGWAAVVACAAALAVLSYRRLEGGRGVRGVLASARGVVLVLLAMLACGPSLMREQVRIEPDWVVVLVDRSASLTIEDAHDAAGRPISREAQMRAALAGASEEFARLSRDRRVLWLGFAGGAFELEPDGSGIAELGAPTGLSTSLGGAISEALRRTAGRPLSAIVIVSDGRSVDEPAASAIRQLRQERVQVVVTPLGSAEPMSDLALGVVEAPSQAFTNDLVRMHVRVDRHGAGDGPGAVVRLVETSTGRVVDEQRVEAGPAGSHALTLATRHEHAEGVWYSVEIVPEGRDLSVRNNVRQVEVAFVDRPLRVAYFDGYPRWEFRYLKNLLLRERTIRSSNVLLAADRQYIQESDVLMTSLPRTTADWSAYDVVLLGDVRGELLTTVQAEALREHIASRGAGLIWIAGSGATPRTWRESPLADLLPFSPSAFSGGDPPVWPEPVTLVPTEAARLLGVLALPGTAGGGSAEEEGGVDLTDPAGGWTLLRWAQRIPTSSLKSAAEVLAEGRPAGGSSEASALVISMRYGSGRVLYVATDETWRWRFGRGEALSERFWVPLIRLLGSDSLGRGGQSASLRATPTDVLVEQGVRIELRVLDQAFIDARPSSTPVAIRRKQEGLARPVTAALVRTDSAESAAMSFGGLWTPTEPGEYVISVNDPRLVDKTQPVQVTVRERDDELRFPEADHGFLARLAASAEDLGAVVPIESLHTVPPMLQRRELRLEAPPEVETLWDKPWALIALLTLLVVEWVGRRMLTLA